MKHVWLHEEGFQQGFAAAKQAWSKPAPVAPHPELTVAVDLAASLQTLAAGEHVHDGMLKIPADLDRYRQIIEATGPDLVVETGTHTGASAKWFARQGCQVVTVDINQRGGITYQSASKPTVLYIQGDSTDPAIAKHVKDAVFNSFARRVMVVLDSDHSAAHVAKEIDLYGPLVTAGCYLVVEDTIFGYAPQDVREAHIPGQEGSPLDAVAEKLAKNPDWSRDLAVERLSPTSHHPAGFWTRNG
jgi:cephalosporin hydroxylase